MQLMVSLEPGIFTLADAVLATGQFATDEDFIKISSNGKFGAVRCEAFNMGYYADGSQPPTPLSPVDDSDFSADELLWLPILTSLAAPAAGFQPGQLLSPQLAPFSIGRLIVSPYVHFFDRLNNKEVEEIYAFDTGITNAQIFNWGVSLLICIAQRLSVQTVSSANPVQGGGTSSGGTSGGGSGPGVGASGPASPDATIALTPSVMGAFTVAHGLSGTPRNVEIEMTSDGEIWEAAPADGTNLYLFASAGGITGSALVWL